MQTPWKRLIAIAVSAGAISLAGLGAHQSAAAQEVSPSPEPSGRARLEGTARRANQEPGMRQQRARGSSAEASAPAERSPAEGRAAREELGTSAEGRGQGEALTPREKELLVQIREENPEMIPRLKELRRTDRAAYKEALREYVQRGRGTGRSGEPEYVGPREPAAAGDRIDALVRAYRSAPPEVQVRIRGKLRQEVLRIEEERTAMQIQMLERRLQRLRELQTTRADRVDPMVDELVDRILQEGGREAPGNVPPHRGAFRAPAEEPYGRVQQGATRPGLRAPRAQEQPPAQGQWGRQQARPQLEGGDRWFE